jgi:hypothetical protein
MKNMQNMKIGNKIIKVLIVERQKPHKKVEERRREAWWELLRCRHGKPGLKNKTCGPEKRTNKMAANIYKNGNKKF